MRKRLRGRGKACCICLVGIFLMAWSFMGIEKFQPEERSINIVNQSQIVSSEVAVEDASEEYNTDLKIQGKAAVLIDGNSGEILYEKEPYKHLPPASVTKVMTLLLILEGVDSKKISLKDKVTISERAAAMGGSQMYMEPGERHTVEELLKGVIMVSANDGCVALAEHLCGSVEGFVKKMNSRATSLNLKNSNFVNTNGLPVAKHYSCAYDIGIITKELIGHEVAKPWFTIWQEDIKVGLPGKQSKFTLTNTNKLVRSYSGAIGVKTGFTQEAGYCLSGAAQREGTTMVGVVLGCKTSDIRFAEMGRLLDYGFANYETVKVAKKGEIIKKLPVQKGKMLSLNAVSKENIGITVKKGNEKSIRKKIITYKSVDLPIKKGDKVGEIHVYENKKEIGKYDLTSHRAIEKAGFIELYIRMMKNIL